MLEVTNYVSFVACSQVSCQAETAFQLVHVREGSETDSRLVTDALLQLCCTHERADARWHIRKGVRKRVANRRVVPTLHSVPILQRY